LQGNLRSLQVTGIISEAECEQLLLRLAERAALRPPKQPTLLQ
jgi:hypothetical protein